jgi:hypothetical protein
MPEYRAYILDREGHIIRPVELFCENDDAAKEDARKLVDGDDVELWQLDRKIATFQHHHPKVEG